MDQSAQARYEEKKKKLKNENKEKKVTIKTNYIRSSQKASTLMHLRSMSHTLYLVMTVKA